MSELRARQKFPLLSRMGDRIWAPKFCNFATVAAPQTGFLKADDLTKTLGIQNSALLGGNFSEARFVSGWRHLGPCSAHASVVKRCQKCISHFKKKFLKKAPNPFKKLIFFRKFHFCSRILATFLKYPEVLDWG